MSSLKLQKTITRVKERIADREFYEAHQALRAVAARYIKLEQYDQAIEIIFEGAQEFLKAGEGGSGGDLSCYLVETYRTGHVPVDGKSKGRIVQLLKLFKEGEPRKKQFMKDIIQWSLSSSGYAFGDPELNHVLGQTYAEDSLVYDAERLLFVGTKESVVVLTDLLYEWYSEDPYAETAPFYLSRAVFGYLSVSNIRDANRAINLFIEKFMKSNRVGSTGNAGSSADNNDIVVFNSYPLLNFLQLLVKVCQRKNADLFKRLKFKYKAELQAAGALDEALDRIGEIYCGIQPPRGSGNILDLMGSLLGGGASQAQLPASQSGADLD
ncbi:hypothetical protein V1511DRAFT_472327 [Dipodascopsis uninucleata]